MSDLDPISLAIPAFILLMTAEFAWLLLAFSGLSLLAPPRGRGWTAAILAPIFALIGFVRLFALPGVPRECRAMFVSGVRPCLGDAARSPPASRCPTRG